MTLSDFLLARISEDEALARAVLAAEGYQVWQVQDWVEIDPTALDHADRHHPHRVLADCEARRSIVESHARAGTASISDPVTARADGLYDAMVHLAQPFSGHADFDPAWRPAHRR